MVQSIYRNIPLIRKLNSTKGDVQIYSQVLHLQVLYVKCANASRGLGRKQYCLGAPLINSQ